MRWRDLDRALEAAVALRTQWDRHALKTAEPRDMLTKSAASLRVRYRA